MSVERIESLHLEASEHYINGRFDDAVRAWRQVLTLDPANAQALEGVRMSALLSDGAGAGASPGSEPAAAAEIDASFEAVTLDAEIDAGLKVFEFEAPHDPVGDLPDPSRQSEGIDFGDLGDVSAIPLAGAAPGATEPILQGEETGLAPIVAHRPGTDPAVEELNRRVRLLLDEAKVRAAQGETEAALAILGRVQVLDENNAEAQRLESELRSATAQSSGEIDRWMIEGVQAFEGGMLDESRGWFVKVLERMPEHAEALHYLRKLGATNAPGHSGTTSEAQEKNDLLSAFLSGAEPLPPEPAATGAPPIRPSVRDDAPIRLQTVDDEGPRREPMRARPPRFGETFEPPARRRGGRGGLLAVLVVVGGVAVAGAWYVQSRKGGAESAAAQAAPVRPKPAPASAAAAPVEKPEAKPVPLLGASLARGRAAMDRGDFEGAILAFNEAIEAEPTSVDAQVGMAEATERYKAVKAEQAQIEGVRRAFEDGEYASALRVLYRLPDRYDKATVDRWKANGWFNLAVVALRAGEVPQANQHLDEVLAIREDADARKWKAFVKRYESALKDRAYYVATESIPFRKLDD